MKGACLALLLAGCIAVTINVTFPQEKLESAASSIEDLVGSGAPPKSPPSKSEPPKPEKQSQIEPGSRSKDLRRPEIPNCHWGCKPAPVSETLLRGENGR